jgi:hypothetical protein
MNYLVTHYKNLAEQLQARINHIQQCLYEMDDSRQSIERPDGTWVDDKGRPIPGSPNYRPDSVVGTNTTPPVVYPKVNPPFTTPESVDPARWGIDPENPPNPMTPAWMAAFRAYMNALRIFNRYQELQNRQKPRRS